MMKTRSIQVGPKEAPKELWMEIASSVVHLKKSQPHCFTKSKTSLKRR